MTTFQETLEETLKGMGFRKALELTAEELAEKTEFVDIQEGLAGASASVSGQFPLYSGLPMMGGIALYFILRGVADYLPHDGSPEEKNINIKIYGVTDTGKKELIAITAFAI